MTRELPAAATQMQPKGADAQKEVALLLLDALQKLADTGEVDAACRIAGKACVILRRSTPDSERRFNALLHRLSRRLA